MPGRSGDYISPPTHPRGSIRSQNNAHAHCVGGDMQLRLKLCPITSPDRPGLSDFSRVCGHLVWYN